VRSDTLKRHIGLVHEAKANKKQREAAKKNKAGKWLSCDRCLATMDKKNLARHLKVCTGRSVKVESRATGVRRVVPRGPKALKTLEILGYDIMIDTKVEQKFEEIERKGTQESR